MKYHIPVSWTMSAIVEIEANSLVQAKRLVQVSRELPAGTYVSDSFQVDEDALDDMERND